MNILTFVLALMMMFAITTSTMLKKNIFSKHLATSFKGYMQSSRKLLNDGEYLLHNRIEEKESTKKTKHPIKAKNKVNPRKIKPHYGKINIYKLIVDKKENQKELYKMLQLLVKELYNDKSFYEKGFEKALVENIISALKNQKKQGNELQLETLILKDANLQKIYYKILKGTKYYDYEQNMGLASLLDFIKINLNDKKIPIKHASFELLVSLFDKQIASDIKQMQTSRNFENLNAEYILGICKNSNIKNVHEETLKLFDFSKNYNKDKEKILFGCDEKTDIKIKLSV
jgi:hypothetical protein